MAKRKNPAAWDISTAAPVTDEDLSEMYFATVCALDAGFKQVSGDALIQLVLLRELRMARASARKGKK